MECVASQILNADFPKVWPMPCLLISRLVAKKRSDPPFKTDCGKPQPAVYFSANRYADSKIIFFFPAVNQSLRVPRTLFVGVTAASTCLVLPLPVVVAVPD